MKMCLWKLKTRLKLRFWINLKRFDAHMEICFYCFFYYNSSSNLRNVYNCFVWVDKFVFHLMKKSQALTLKPIFLEHFCVYFFFCCKFKPKSYNRVSNLRCLVTWIFFSWDFLLIVVWGIRYCSNRASFLACFMMIH